MIPQSAIFADDRVRMGKKVVPDNSVRVDHDMRQKRGVVAEDDLFADDGIRANVGVLSDFCRRVNDCRGMDSWGVLRLLIEKPYDLRKRQIRVGCAQGRGGYFREVRRNKDCSGPGGSRKRGIAGIGDKRHLLRAGFFESCDTGDWMVRVALKFSVKNARKFG